ncbi:hypothetical protein HW532_15570 [Kaustia mangrovi]|uniref:Uncharacterized protein n=1 Tax=Kaustia mangrovi TaxID=2593653 RepID=A0A7S8C5W8_9HYPH|nr:hypothetical protein [Kaustia mangrovi]QPC43983.1 hypothetical protein HW532_15570 [Kaustia mangrovi]
MQNPEGQLNQPTRSASLPTKPGFFWARWLKPAPGTADNGECCNPDEWEVMHVVENTFDPSDPEYLMVMVPGVEHWQPMENFHWGAEVRRAAQ